MAKLPFCLCGVRGGHLATRIEEIVANRRRSELTRARRTALVFAAITVGIAPVFVGALTMRSQVQQSSLSDRPRFEVASIKRTLEVTGPGADFSAMPGGRFHARNNEVSNLIGNAYGVPRYLMANIPDWVTSARYDLEGKAADPARPATADGDAADAARGSVQVALASGDT